jgi:hypothetical protein
LPAGDPVAETLGIWDLTQELRLVIAFPPTPAGINMKEKRTMMLTLGELIDRTKESIRKRQRFAPSDPFHLTPAEANELLAELARWDEPLDPKSAGNPPVAGSALHTARHTKD